MEEQTQKKLRCVALPGGLAAIVCGFLYDVLFAGIPYQDSTSAMQQRYDFHSGVAALVEIAGALMVLSGCIMWIVGRIGRGKCERIVQTDSEDAAI